MTLFTSISAQERINFARHLHLTVKSGLPLIDGLKLVLEQTSSRGLRELIDTIITDVSKGKLLGEALKAHRRVFGEFFLHIVSIGEQSGNLSENLLYLANELKKRKDTRSQIRAALVYPIILFVATISIAIFLVFFVLPKILPILTDLNVDLPATTRFLIWVVNFFSAYGLYFLGGSIAFLVGLKLSLKAPPIRYTFHRMFLFIPIISKMVIYLSVVNFTRSLGLLLKSGVSVVDALGITADTMGNLVYRRQVREVAISVQEGGSIGEYLAERKQFFPIMFANLVRVGESTGSLEGNLEYLADYYSDEIEGTVKNLTAVVEPIMLLFMGLLVGFIAISIILPIYKISTPNF